VIAIANQKGGTGKTSTAAALGYLLGQHAPTLLIDADPQGNLTQSFGIRPDKLERTLYEVLVQGLPIDQIIQHLSPPPAALWLIGSNLDLAQTTLQVAGRPTWAILLRNALATIRSRFKFIVIDCPPNLDALTVNALVAATEVIVPVEMGAFSLRGTSRLLDVIRDLQVLNPTLPSPRFLACRVKSNSRLSSRIQDDLGQGFAGRLFNTVIREGTAVGQSQYAKQPLAVYAPTSSPAKDYEALCKELLHE
jgi:chromosome partitioning protein